MYYSSIQQAKTIMVAPLQKEPLTGSTGNSCLDELNGFVFGKYSLTSLKFFTHQSLSSPILRSFTLHPRTRQGLPTLCLSLFMIFIELLAAAIRQDPHIKRLQTLTITTISAFTLMIYYCAYKAPYCHCKEQLNSLIHSLISLHTQ